MLNDIKKKMKHLAASGNRTRFIFVIGIAGIVLIALSGINTSGKSSEKQGSAAMQSVDTDDAERFKEMIKGELEDILKKIDGVGECSVMLSVEGTNEYVFAENTDRAQDTDSNGSSDKFSNEIVIIDGEGGRQALVKKVIRPKISGVVVVCRGGGDITVKERVIKAVSAALGLPYGRICVEGKTMIER
jgi:stage III sporulation protein AG